MKGWMLPDGRDRALRSVQDVDGTVRKEGTIGKRVESAWSGLPRLMSLDSSSCSALDGESGIIFSLCSGEDLEIRELSKFGTATAVALPR